MVMTDAANDLIISAKHACALSRDLMASAARFDDVTSAALTKSRTALFASRALLAQEGQSKTFPALKRLPRG
jgi:hypothetical protein